MNVLCTEICGTSASLRCGNEVLLKIDDGEDVDEKCELRKVSTRMKFNCNF